MTLGYLRQKKLHLDIDGSLMSKDFRKANFKLQKIIIYFVVVQRWLCTHTFILKKFHLNESAVALKIIYIKIN